MWSVATYEARLKNFDSNAYQDIANEVMGSINLWDDDTTTF
jgi:hypothetical protein